MMDIGSLFIQVLAVISDTISSLLGFLPNPDPFPEILDGLQISASDSFAVAYYWLDQFIIADAVITCIGTWILMFPLAWIIMMLWKWVKAR